MAEAPGNGPGDPAERTEQLWLFPDALSDPATPDDAASPLERALRRRAGGRPVRVVYTRNRTVILSLRSQGETTVLRAHECFRDAPEEVREAIAQLYLGRPRRVDRRRLTTVVSAWHQQAARPPESPALAELRHGRYHHLPTILDIVNRAYFDGRLEMDITYGSRPARQMMARHEARADRSLILVNPLLDNSRVKSWYMHYLVFHECLHEVIPPRVHGNRLLLHPPEFRQHEELHPDVERARRYERWLAGRGHARLRADYLTSRNQARTITTPAPLAARRTRRKRRGKGSSGAGSP